MIVIIKFDDPCKGQLNIPTDFLCVKEFENSYQVMVLIQNNKYQNFYQVKQFEVMP